MEAAKLARELGSKQGKKQAGHTCGGPIYIEDARATMQTREDQEIAKDNCHLVRMWEEEEGRERRNALMHVLSEFSMH
jgi:hypothetical protein